jgi:hypothetical protein
VETEEEEEEEECGDVECCCNSILLLLVYLLHSLVNERETIENRFAVVDAEMQWRVNMIECFKTGQGFDQFVTTM